MPWEESSSSVRSSPLSSRGTNRQAFSTDDPPVCPRPAIPQTKFPASVSIETLLNAGKLVQPRKKTVLDFEKFDIESGSWKNAMNVECEVECEKFSSGAFRDAFHVTTKQGEKWVLKKYNGKATDIILNALKSTVQNHCRKQIQMHSVARHIASKFKRSPPSTFGQCFTYNRCYYTSFDGQPATI